MFKFGDDSQNLVLISSRLHANMTNTQN